MLSDEPKSKTSLMLYVCGYAIASAWAAALLMSSVFANSATQRIVTGSMLAGVVACVAALLLRRFLPPFEGRSLPIAFAALGMAVGTLLCTYPDLAAIPAIRESGLVLSGFCAMWVILAWFEAFARLNPRTIVMLAGCSMLTSALLCLATLALPPQAGSMCITLLPLLSFALLPHYEPVGDGIRARPLGRIVKEAVTPRTLLGIAVAFFVIGAVKTITEQQGLETSAHPASLALPVAAAALVIGFALVAPRRFDASLPFKVLLIALAGTAYLLVNLNVTDLWLLLSLYIAADVLLWTVLCLISKKTPVAPYAVFIVGWLAECAGNVLGSNVAAFAEGAPHVIEAVIIALVLVAVAFMFGDDQLKFPLEETPEEEPGGTGAPEGEQDAPSHVQDAHEAAVARFAEAHGLSSRETEVLAHWLTGHGLKRIQSDLFISESTVKTHLRNIYRKCDTHSRAEIIDLFEKESAPAESR